MLVVSMMISFSMSVLLPMYFENVFEMTALFAGLMLLAPIFGNAIAAVISGRIMDKFGEWPLIPAGFLCILVGQFGIALIAPSINTVAVVLCAVVVYCGVGFCMSPVQTAGLKCLNHELHAHGISIINTIIMVSAAIGPSLFIGTQAAGVAEAAAAGSTVIVANAMGFSQAIWLATGVALIGLAVAIPYSLKAHKRDKDAREVLEENEK